MPDRTPTSILFDDRQRAYLKDEANRQGHGSMGKVARQLVDLHMMAGDELRDELARLLSEVKSAPRVGFSHVKDHYEVHPDDVKASNVLGRIREKLPGGGSQRGERRQQSEPRKNGEMGMLAKRRESAIKTCARLSGLGVEAVRRRLRRLEDRSGEVKNYYEFWRLTNGIVLRKGDPSDYESYTVFCAWRDLDCLSDAAGYEESLAECLDSLDAYLSLSDQEKLRDDLESKKPRNPGMIFVCASDYINQADYVALWKSMRNEIINGEAIPRDA